MRRPGQARRSEKLRVFAGASEKLLPSPAHAVREAAAASLLCLRRAFIQLPLDAFELGLRKSLRRELLQRPQRDLAQTAIGWRSGQVRHLTRQQGARGRIVQQSADARV